MRILTFLSLIFLSVSLSAVAQVGHWRLDNNAEDATVNNIDGTLQNTPSFSTADKKEGTHALVLNGTNQYIDLGNPSSLPSGTSAKTISAWAKTNTETGSGVIFAYGSPSTSQAFYLGMNGTSLVGGAFGNSLTVSNVWATGVWHHVCMTYDGTTVKLYADGIEVSSSARSWGVVLSRTYIGRHVNNSNYWNGSIDDVRIYSTALSASQVAALAVTGPQGPVAPTSLTATTASSTQINLSWADNATDETGYQIERSETSSTTGFSLIHTTAANGVSYSNTGLTPGTTYYYRIRAVNGNGNSAYAEASATTTGSIPTAPTNPAVTASSSTAINVSWNDNSTNETGFEIHRSATINGTYSLIHTTGANVTSYVNGSLTPATTYFYQVRAVNALGASTYTSPQGATTLSGGSGNGPVGHWKLNNNAHDESGSNYHGTLVGSPVFTSDKKEGTHSLSFDGTGYVELGNPAGLPSGTSARSISVWAKTNTTTTGDHMIVAYGTNASSQGMFVGQSGTSLFVGGWSNNITVPNVWNEGQWHHICLTYDGTTAKVYVDGEEKASTAKTWNLVLQRAYIGRHLSNTAYWQGSIDDARIYNKALSLAEVQAIIQESSADPVQQALNDFAFQYRYDAKRRMTQKKVPGADWVYMVYDHRDRLVLTQDGNQRAETDQNGAATPQWTFTKYDALNRPIITGIYTHAASLDQEAMQTFVNGQYGTPVNGQYDQQKFYEDFNGSASTMGYTNRTFPTMSTETLTLTYYDRYDFKSLIGGTADDYATNQLSSQVTTPNNNVLGQVTGSQVKVLGTSTFLWSVNYYDDKYRAIQTIAANQLGATDRVTNVYDFVGKVKATKTVHNVGLTNQQIVERNFDYDHAGRLLKVWHTLNTQPKVLLAKNEYNELGQLVDKKLHNTDPPATPDASRVFKQSVDYRYNIRGWLTSMNDLAVPEAGDLFGMNLNYNTPTANGGAAQYNGNISEILWKSADGQNQSYGYTYDPMNRLVEGKYYNTTNTTKNNRFNEKIWDAAQNKSGYDLNGNILFLQRNGKTGVDAAGVTTYGTMDNITYTYTGNQLLKVADVAVKTEGFLDGANTGDDYAYDVNGNMFKDENKLITDASTSNGASRITYNHLNLVDKVVKSNGEYIKYSYDAAGIKLSQVVYNASNVQQKKTDYAGEFIYETTGAGSPSLMFINHEEGRIIPGATPEYQYHIKDHLGNVRLTFTTKQETTSNTATFESANRTAESSQFLRYDRVRIVNNSPLFDHTNGTSTGSSIRLSGGANEKTGLVKTISVMPGDVINMEVYAKYLDKDQVNWTSQLLQVVNPIISGTAGIVTDGGNYSTNSSTPFPYTGINNTSTSTGAGPKAYLNYIFFDRDYVPTLPNEDPTQTFYVQVPSSAKESGANLESNPNGVPHALLSASVTVKKAGYLYIYLSNEETTPVEVYFDDFKVTQVKSPVVQMDDYYPFGLTFNSHGRENNIQNFYKFSGKELEDELNLGWFDFGWRAYDPSVARWNAIDQYSTIYEENSPYSYVANNPIIGKDFQGKLIIYVNGFRPLDAAVHAARRAKDSRYPRHNEHKENWNYTDVYEYWTEFNNSWSFPDEKRFYVDGSDKPESMANDRFNRGRNEGKILAEKIKSGEIKLEDGEMIKLIGHSMGAAHAMGMAQGLIDAGINSKLIQLLLFAPHQPNQMTSIEVDFLLQAFRDSDKISSTGTIPDLVNSEPKRIGNNSDYAKMPDGNDDGIGNHSVQTYTAEEFKKTHPRLYQYLIEKKIISPDGNIRRE